MPSACRLCVNFVCSVNPGGSCVLAMSMAVMPPGSSAGSGPRGLCAIVLD